MVGISTKMACLQMFPPPRSKTSIIVPSKHLHTISTLFPSIQQRRSIVRNTHSTCHSDHQHSSNSPFVSQNSFDFEAYMLEKRNSVKKALEEAIPIQEPLKLYESMRYTMLAEGRKRFRPVVCIAACELVGGTESNAMPAACALEMIHNAHLMLDDLPCQDNDDFRGGKQTNHKIFGEGVTVLASAGLIAQSFQHLTATMQQQQMPPELIVKVISELSKSAGPQGAVGGQYDDLSSDGVGGLGLDHVKSIHIRKTAIMLEAAAVMGCILGGGDDYQIAKLRRYARCTALMFAVMDDVVDVSKDSVSDKATYPKLIGMERSKELAFAYGKEALELLTSGFDSHRTAPLVALANYNYFFG